MREISEEAFKAATPTTRARPNSQTLLTSNAGDAFSTVLNDMRERALSYPAKSFGFYEYSAPIQARQDIHNTKYWAMANPALGHTVTEAAIQESIATNSIETTLTETLCMWIDSQVSPWTFGAIEATSLSDLILPVGAMTVLAFDVNAHCSCNSSCDISSRFSSDYSPTCVICFHCAVIHTCNPLGLT